MSKLVENIKEELIKYTNLTDEIVIKLCIGNSGRINPNVVAKNTLNELPKLKYYLENRFPKDEFKSYSLVIYRLQHKIYEWPICANPNCNNKVKNLKRSKYCCKTCAAIDDLYKQHIVQSQKRALELDPNFYKKRSEKEKQTRLLLRPDNPYPSNPEKSKETRKQHLKEDPLYYEKIKQKTRNTRKNLYGDENYTLFGSDSYIKTIQEKYNDTTIINPFQAEEVKDKCRATMIEKYNAPYTMQSPELIKKWRYNHIHNNSLYFYKNIFFDSSWELIFYIYCEDNNIPVEREPYYIEYVKNNSIHRYFPDFRINNNDLVEIKNTRAWDKLKIENIEKFNCVINNVSIIILDEDFKFYSEWFKNKYGKKYLKQFKYNSNKGGKDADESNMV